jgi:chromosome segregation ATPase
MLEQNDLRQIKEIMDSSLEELAIIVDKGFEAVDKRFEAVDKRFDGIEKRLDSIEGEMRLLRKRLDDIEIRLEAMEDRMDRLFKMESEDLSAVTKELETAKKRMFIIERHCGLAAA